MSDTELARLAAEQARLEEALLEIRKKRHSIEEQMRQHMEAERKRIESEKPVVVRVGSIRYNSVAIKVEPTIRSDILEILRGTPGREFSHYNSENLIPLKEWLGFLGKLVNRPHVSIEYADGIEDEIDELLNMADWNVSYNAENEAFTVVKGPFTHDIPMWRIPGTGQGHTGTYVVPSLEAWRIPKVFADYAKDCEIRYTPEAAEEIERVIKSRDRLNEIAALEDVDDPRFELLTRVVTLQDGSKKPFKDALRGFQKVGILFLLESGGRTLLGDDTGLGKTWESIAFAEILRAQNKASQILIACKPANLQNWVRHIKNLTGEDAVICRTTVPEAGVMKAVAVDRAPYVVISHDTMAKYIKAKDDNGDEEKVYMWRKLFTFNGESPDVLIIDEAHKYKNPDTYRFKAIKPLAKIKHVIPMTATPVINRTGEFWGPLHMARPELFSSEQRFLSIYTDGFGGPANVDRLQEMLRPMFLRRKKIDVWKNLPPKNRIIEYRDLSDEAAERYRKAERGVYEVAKEYDPKGKGGEEQNIMAFLAQIMRLKQICAADMVYETVDLAKELDDQNGTKRRILIFSHFLGTARSIADELGEQAVCTVVRTPDDFVSMQPHERDEVFQMARHDESIRFIVTTEASNEGHDIEYCDRVIFNDLWWSPMTHSQAEDRAYGRTSDPHPIDAFYMLSTAQIMEWIWDLIQKKLSIIDSTVEGVELSREATGSIAKELLQLVKANMRLG